MDLGWFEVSLDVQDIEVSRDFYEKLGFQVVDGSVEARVLTLQNGDCRVGLYQGHLDPPQTQLIFWQGDVGAIRDGLTAQGLRFEPKPPAKEGARGDSAMVKDPDGHPIYFINLPGVTRKEPA